MSRFVTRARAHLSHLWRLDPPLTFVGLLMLPVLLACVVGLWLDPRTVLGAPVWLKPAKFAVSIALYSLTLAWVFSHLPHSPRTRRVVGTVSAAAFAIEVLIIAAQAARGTTSHFNASTPLDAALYAVMGLTIVAQTLTSVAVAVALWRQTFPDQALGWALRLGMTITIVGASLGGIMPRPTSEQLEAMRARGGPVSVVGAHTVGAPDGGPGLSGTGWSREHGDLRVPHFLGLHALQALPLVAILSRRTRLSQHRRLRLVQATAASYVGLLSILLWQALRGQPLLAPDSTTSAALIAWLSLTLALAGGALLASPHNRRSSNSPSAARRVGYPAPAGSRRVRGGAAASR